MRKTIGGRERETGGERNKLAKRRVGGKEADSGERSIWRERETNEGGSEKMDRRKERRRERETV